MYQGIFFLLALLITFSQAASNWFINTEIKQDFRYRWQEERYDNLFVLPTGGVTTNSSAGGKRFSRYRERISYRFGVESKANEEMKIAARLATNGWGKDDPLSTNDTLGERDGFTKDSIVLDQAYLEYIPLWFQFPNSFLTLTLGKFDVKTGLFTITDLMWDSDISLEGKNLRYLYEFEPNKTAFFANLGSYVVLEDPHYDDFILNVQQVGLKWVENEMYSLDAAMARYFRAKAGSVDAPSVGLGISPINENILRFNINTEIGLLEKISLLWNEYTNTNESRENHGSAIGFEIGTAKVAKLGDWSFRNLTRRLEKNVGWTLGNSDIYGGETGKIDGLNVYGVEYSLSLGLAENAIFGIYHHLMKTINDSLDNDKGAQSLTQFNVVVRF